MENYSFIYFFNAVFFKKNIIEKIHFFKIYSIFEIFYTELNQETLWCDRQYSLISLLKLNYYFIFRLFYLVFIFKFIREAFSMFPIYTPYNCVPYSQLHPLQSNYNSYLSLVYQQYNFTNHYMENHIQNTEVISQNPTRANEGQTIKKEQQKDIPRKQPKKRIKNAFNEKKSGIKNGESNIINQFFALFANRNKSSEIIYKITTILGKHKDDQQKILTVFYRVVRLINRRRGKKYVNRWFLKKILIPQRLKQLIPQLKTVVQQIDKVPLHLICKIFRKCVNHYLRSMCTCTLLTSKRISTISKIQHLRRRRIMTVLTNTLGTE